MLRGTWLIIARKHRLAIAARIVSYRNIAIPSIQLQYMPLLCGSRPVPAMVYASGPEAGT
jgi:hypothetical protein